MFGISGVLILISVILSILIIILLNIGISGEIISGILTLISVILSILIIILLIGWWYGGGNLVLPGLGLVVSPPATIILLLILNIVFVVFTGFIKSQSQLVETSKVRQNFEFPNDIFSGCGNGTLTLFLVKDPKNYHIKLDHDLKICINSDDIAAIQDSVVSGRVKYDNLNNSVDFQKADEQNQKFLQKFASIYPLLGKINDVYEDYIFNPEEVVNLRKECLKIQSQKPNAAADLGLRKLIYACDKAIKENIHLVFICD